jgi:TetR/AcrR family transcriptional regulator
MHHFSQREELRRRRDEMREQIREQIRELREQLRQKRHEHRMGSRGQPEESRAAILEAATKEFAEQGIAGARTDAIARAARVNKALLYYYFGDKEALYGAVLDNAFDAMRAAVFQALDSDLPVREKVMAYAGTYFDFISSNPIYPKLMQREMMRARVGDSQHIERLVKTYFQPVYERVAEVLRKGIKEGEFRKVDPAQFVPSMIAIIVFYFSSAPVMRQVFRVDPLAPERIAERRAAVLDFISAALFKPCGSTASRHTGVCQ